MQTGFISGCGTKKAFLFILRHLQENYLAKKKNLHFEEWFAATALCTGAVIWRYSVKKVFLKFRKIHTGKRLCRSLFINAGLQLY